MSSCAEIFAVIFAVHNDPARGYFGRLDPHDGRLYSFFLLSTLMNHISDASNDAHFAWLVRQFTLGRLYRAQISLAHQMGDEDFIFTAPFVFRHVLSGL
jgi:hypothetical protein